MKKHITYLDKLNACTEALEWAESYPTLQKAWDACERGDWMLWLIGKQSDKPESKSRKKLVLTACKCARLSLKYVPKNEKRPLKAIQAAEKWAKGDTSISLAVKNAAASAASASSAAYAAAYASSAASSDAYAAASASSAADAAYAADAAAAAAYAAAAAAYATAAAAYARSKVLKQCADIVREDYPKIIIK